MKHACSCRKGAAFGVVGSAGTIACGDCPSSGLPVTFSPQAGRRRYAVPVSPVPQRFVGQVPSPRLRGEG
nr:hypothetical protein SHINE37_10572 [Rhizobiaceae bacterium]